MVVRNIEVYRILQQNWILFSSYSLHLFRISVLHPPRCFLYLSLFIFPVTFCTHFIPFLFSLCYEHSVCFSPAWSASCTFSLGLQPLTDAFLFISAIVVPPLSHLHRYHFNPLQTLQKTTMVRRYRFANRTLRLTFYIFFAPLWICEYRRWESSSRHVREQFSLYRIIIFLIHPPRIFRILLLNLDW